MAMPANTDKCTSVSLQTATHSQPLRVCAVAYTFYQSDARVMRYNKSLVARGDEVDVITLRECGRPKITVSDGVRIIGIQSRKVNERSQLSYLLRILMFFVRAMVLLSWRQLRVRYDVIHIHSVPDFLVFTAWLPKLMGAKLILDIHDLLPELYASKFGVRQESLVFRVLLGIERVSAAFADHLITANDLWQEKLVRRAVASGKATALLNYPDRSVFRPRGRTRINDKFVLIYPGTLNWHQGMDIAIEALARIKSRAPNAELHIYGVGPALTDLRKLAAELGMQDRVRFNGMLPLDEVARRMENSDVGVVPKRKDSFGNEAFSTKTLEFMAMGVPVIVSDTKIDTYYFNDSVVKFFRGGDPEHLADRMLELMTDRMTRESLRQNGLQFVETNCWDAKKQLYFNILESLVGAPSGKTRSIRPAAGRA
jgi:glycosyltransferase involved in cell wall biosynthesis